MRLLVVATLLLGLTSTSARAQDPCAPDAALERAARALVERDRPLEPGALLDAAREAGSDAPVVDALVIRDGDAARRDRFLARVAARRRAPLACADARREGVWLVLAAPRAGRLAQLRNGAIRVELADGWSRPRLFARDAAGRTAYDEPTPGAAFRIASDLTPPIDLQLVADGPDGPRPVAELRLGGGAPSGATPRIAHSGEGPTHPQSNSDPDAPIAVRLAALRDREGVSRLRDNRLLARVAAAHARDVCHDGDVAHIRDSQDPRDRLARAGLRARSVGEVIAAAEDVSRAYAALLRSPSHRAALTDRRFTDAGVGTAQTGDRTCLVVLLAAWPRAVPFRVGESSRP